MAPIIAKKCHPRVSRWVFRFILTCDKHLAVTFRPHGVCCLYPTTNEGHYNLATIWASAGKFVWRFLYRKMPYQLIKDPCPPRACNFQTGCCPAAFPATLHATVTGAGSTAIIYDAVLQKWKGSLLLACASTLYIRFYCPAGGTTVGQLTIETSWDDITYAVCNNLMGSRTCSPLSITSDTCFPGGSGGAGCAATFSVTVTV